MALKNRVQIYKEFRFTQVELKKYFKLSKNLEVRKLNLIQKASE
jgi:hypothetical protein